VTTDEAREQGFVTVVHDEEKLRLMHALAPSVVAVERRASASGGEGSLAGYALTMLPEARSLIPVLDPMFQQFERLSFHGKPLSNFYVMGQICVARGQRGKGVVDALYAGHRDLYAGRFDAIVTEIAVRNIRSARAHARVGFEEIHRFRDETDDWSVVAWDFK
jgi:hypothetical protein